VAVTHDSAAAARSVPRWVWFVALGALALAAGLAVGLIFGLGGGKQEQVLGAVALDQPLAGATVDLGNGTTTKTDPAGNFLASTHLPKTFSVTASGGPRTGSSPG